MKKIPFLAILAALGMAACSSLPTDPPAEYRGPHQSDWQWHGPPPGDTVPGKGDDWRWDQGQGTPRNLLRHETRGGAVFSRGPDPRAERESGRPSPRQGRTWTASTYGTTNQG